MYNSVSTPVLLCDDINSLTERHRKQLRLHNMLKDTRVLIYWEKTQYIRWQYHSVQTK